MRRLLYAIACFVAAWAVLAVAMAVLMGPPVADLMAALVLLAIAAALSAPFELAPPAEREADVVVLFPMPAWLALLALAFRVVQWVGHKTLWALWTAVFAVWDRRRAPVVAE